jgi:hypothetical protein
MAPMALLRVWGSSFIFFMRDWVEVLFSCCLSSLARKELAAWFRLCLCSLAFDSLELRVPALSPVFWVGVRPSFAPSLSDERLWKPIGFRLGLFEF